ncbi:hypothetical protein [Herpetosiphon geysericola]|uniref:Uncharacterized protein n=1 Tax=Herpetosiphon geysericola TaxID=70996 RepID=A0A0P6XVB2_9CHLR|nr:hypothetical protein [Herpetosiphon geysericola]KPL83057.1 hypothetical protein SE18_19655 [Herpetosiphon geysericola]
MGTMIIMTKERRSPLRQALYTKQLELYFELVHRIIEITNLISATLEDASGYYHNEYIRAAMMHEPENWLEEELPGDYESQIDYKTVRPTIERLYDEITAKMEVWINFLPEQISRDIWMFTQYIYDHGIDPERDSDYFDADNSKEFLDKQTKNIVTGIQQHLGIDELSNDILDLFKSRHAHKKGQKKQ